MKTRGKLEEVGIYETTAISHYTIFKMFDLDKGIHTNLWNTIVLVEKYEKSLWPIISEITSV